MWDQEVNNAIQLNADISVVRSWSLVAGAEDSSSQHGTQTRLQQKKPQKK